MTERRPDEIQQEIEQARVTLADAVDQIVYRTAPKHVAAQVKQSLIEKARTPQGKAVLGAAGALVVILIVRRVRHR